MPVVRVPAPLRPLTGGAPTVEVVGATVGQVLDALERDHPGIGARLRDDRGDLHRFVNVFVDDLDVREAGGLHAPVPGHAVVSVVPAVAGG